MMRVIRLATAAAVLCAGWNVLQAAEQFTANTLRLEAGEASPPATIDQMAWLAGTWSGSGFGGVNEEIWSAPRHGTMMGMYRMLKDGQPMVYELLTLGETDAGSLVLRLKHFHPDMRGWEERDESLAWPLVAVRDGRLYFEGITFEPEGDEVTIYLATENRQEGSVHEEVLKYRRDAQLR